MTSFTRRKTDLAPAAPAPHETGVDTTTRSRAQARLDLLARHDSLTGLPNRSLLAEKLTTAVAAADAAGRHVAVVLIDLDDFKAINDAYGHAAGDGIIRRCADSLTACVRSADVVARVGGDEFVVILGDLASETSAARAVQRMRAALAEPATIGIDHVPLGASFGISCFPGDGDSAEELIGFADLAMYRAKRSRRGDFAYFEPALHDAAVARLQREHELGEAIENGELTVHYQPIVDARTKSIGGVEALVRWLHPREGLKLPESFIPLAEDTGLIVPLGEFVLREATRTIAHLQRSGNPGLRLTVNVSQRQLTDAALPNSVLAALAQSGMRTDRLDLAITEAFLVGDPERAAARLGELARLGIRIALDEFGTGYSALAFLRRFPLHHLKLDHSFVAEIERSEISRTIASATVRTARKLGMATTAKGVENAAQYRVLEELGCHGFQGSHVAPPMTAAELAGRLGADALAPAS
jgi:diguanylate cyclase (GGDEF)-like protein